MSFRSGALAGFRRSCRKERAAIACGWCSTVTRKFPASPTRMWRKPPVVRCYGRCPTTSRSSGRRAGKPRHRPLLPGPGGGTRRRDYVRRRRSLAALPARQGRRQETNRRPTDRIADARRAIGLIPSVKIDADQIDANQGSARNYGSIPQIERMESQAASNVGEAKGRFRGKTCPLESTRFPRACFVLGRPRLNPCSRLGPCRSSIRLLPSVISGRLYYSTIAQNYTAIDVPLHDG